MTPPVTDLDDSPATRENLAEVFRETETEPDSFLIGAEAEKIGVHAQTGQPLGYEGEFGVCQIFRWLAQEHGWKSFGEFEGGPILGLKRDGASITLEPGAQFELSGAPLGDVHAIAAEQELHFRELRAVTDKMGLTWLMTGFQPLSSLAELPWVPKQRYPIMRDYLPTKGSGALDMMQRTATVQANFDRSSEADGMRKMVVALRLSPLIHALFANSPFAEGQPTGLLSQRGDVWLRMDPSRSGLIPALWTKATPRYQDYVDWALDAGMFLFRRDGQLLRNTGQTFADFMQSGFEGHRATIGDFKLHLTTLFPEVRLKNTLEVRSADNLPPELSLALVALWTGVLYDEQALRAAEALTADFSWAEVQAARPELVRRGLHAELLGQSGWLWAERLVELARAGLERRGRKNAEGQTEAVFLEPTARLLEARLHPAEVALQRFAQTGSIIEATRFQPAES